MATTASSNGATQVELFRQRLDELYDLVEGALRRVDPGVHISRSTPVQIDEVLTGPYSVASLEAAVPGRPGIRLVPQGIYNIGARGRVDARSRLGHEVLVWVESEGAPHAASADEAEAVIEAATRPVFSGVPEGWAWTDSENLRLVPLTEASLLDDVLPRLLS